MRALDLFCGAGGASVGLAMGGFDVVGVDQRAQPNYPFEFVQADAMDYPLGGFDLVWASPPCQRFVRGGLTNKTNRPDLLTPMIERLRQRGGHWIVENVPGAPMQIDVMLCGSMFGLGVRRHRWFQTSFPPPLVPACNHSEPIVGVYGHPHGKRGAWPGMRSGTLESWSKAMGIDWMSVSEISQAIPPAYSEYLARFLVEVLL